MEIKPSFNKKKKFFGLVASLTLLNLYFVVFGIDSEIKELCQPSDRYNLAESYRPGGELKSFSEDSSVKYSGFVRLSGEGCKKLPNVEIEFWFSDSKGNYSKETRLKVRTDSKGYFEIRTGGFQAGNLPYHIHYLVKGPGIRPLTGNYNNISYNSNDKFDIFVIPADGSNYSDYLSKELRSGDNFTSKVADNSLFGLFKNIESLEKIKWVAYLLQIVLFMLIFSLIKINKRSKLILFSLSFILFITTVFYSNQSDLYKPNSKYLPEINNEKAILENYERAKWAPVLSSGNLIAYNEELLIPEQENMLTQVFVSSLSTIELENELRNYYRNQGIELGAGAVNMWGIDANWQYSYNISGIKLGKEVNITISKKLGDGRLPPEGFNSVAIIWQMESEKINKYIVENFAGFGEGFLDKNNL